MHLWTPAFLPEVRLQDGTRGEALVPRWWIGEVIYFSAADDRNLDQMIDSDNCCVGKVYFICSENKESDSHQQWVTAFGL